jgi:hypothetical protein
MKSFTNITESTVYGYIAITAPRIIVDYVLVIGSRCVACTCCSVTR